MALQGHASIQKYSIFFSMSKAFCMACILLQKKVTFEQNSSLFVCLFFF